MTTANYVTYTRAYVSKQDKIEGQRASKRRRLKHSCNTMIAIASNSGKKCRARYASSKLRCGRQKTRKSAINFSSFFDTTHAHMLVLTLALAYG